MSNSESLLSRLKIHYEYQEEYVDILAMLKSMRIKRALEKLKKKS